MYYTTIQRRIREQHLLHDVTLELTYRCNLDCFYCYNDREKTGIPLSLEQYEILLNDLARMQVMFLMLTGGEPMMHPHFFEIGRLARDLGFVVRVRTNGHSLVPSMAARLQNEVEPYVVEVSLHGATADVHDRQTRVPGSFDRLLGNLESAKAEGLRCTMVTTPTAWNEHQIDEMFVLSERLAVPLSFQGPVAPRDNGDTEPLSIQPAAETWEHIVELQKQRQALQPEAESLLIGQGVAEDVLPEEPAMCSVGTGGVDIDPYGNVQACMHLLQSAGNLHNQSIEEIWNSSPVFMRARAASVAAAHRFGDAPPRQFGAPLFCIAVEENCHKSACSGCGKK